MTTVFPAALDNLSNPIATTPMNSATVSHAEQHQNANDAIEALQAAVGTTGSSVAGSLQYRMAQVEQNTTVRLIDSRFIAHRGGLSMAPENSLSAFSWATSAGCSQIEMDCYLLADGELGVMHDSTVDRTTTGTGNVASLTGAQFKALVLDTPDLPWGSWTTEGPPLFRDVLDLLIRYQWVVVWPEGKNTGAVAAIVCELRRYNLDYRRAIVQVGSEADALVALDGGYYSAYQVDPATANFAALYAKGVRYITWTAFTTQQLSDLHAAGLQAIVYGQIRRVAVDAALAQGVDKIFSDDPLWTSRSTTPRNRSSWQRNRFEPGYFGNGGPSWLPAFFSDGSIGYASSPSSFRGQLQGWACPIQNNEQANTFTLTFDLQFTAVNSDTKWASVFVGSQNDGLWGDLGVNTAVSGYHILLRRNGGITIYKQAIGLAAQQIASQSGSTMTLSTDYQVVITVTPSQISAKIGSGTTLTASDSTYRGGYFHLGCSEAAARFKNLVVS